MTNRCEKHKIFIGKDGCKICNQIQAVVNIGHEHYDWFISECLKNDKLKKENEKLRKENENLKKMLADLAEIVLMGGI